MTNIEAIFFWLALWLYGLGFISFLFGVVFKKERHMRLGWYFVLAGFVSHTSSMAVRWAKTGHPPVMGIYENSTLLGWFIVGVYITARRWHEKTIVAGTFIMPLILLMLGKGVMSDTTYIPLSPPYKSNWLWLHVFFGWTAFASFFVAFGFAVVYLLKERAGKMGMVSEFYEKFPSLGVLNDVLLRVVIFGFICLTVEIGAGAIWAYGLWGRYWAWDPIETWSLITWLTYGTYIHMGVTLGWKGRRMAWLAIFSMIFVFITLGGIGFLGGVHTTLL